ncbi:adenine phosphoribosyltransferase [Candidatus Chlorohelix sp.]|uniref:adenine phosphoribosyltransferase n=1 Tax=Candidatus Chlorohelix sp. TaxID=3139201 RepID=UPI003043FB5B
MDLRDWIRDVPDFPKPGILFKDITPLLQNHKAMTFAFDQMAGLFKGQPIDLVVGIESRGFIFGAPLADRLGAGFVPIRKVGKLPYSTIFEEYDLEYGTNKIEIHEDAIKPGQNVLIVDDLLATGGTVTAAANLVEKLGGKVQGMTFLIELRFLNGREKLSRFDVKSLVEY